MLMEYIVPILRITAVIDMADNNIMEGRLDKMISLEEHQFIIGLCQQVQKAREKASHNRHINKKTFQNGDLVLL